MHRLSLLITILGASFIPLAHAAESAVWDLRDTQTMQTSAQGLTKADITPDGVHINTATDGLLYWATPLLYPADVLTLRVYSPKETEVGLLWHPGDTSLQAQRFITLPAGTGLQDVSVVLGDIPDWDWTTDRIALGFPGGSEVVLQSMTWTRYSATEKLAEAWKSFWTFDEFRAYTINFLWGPLIATSPEGTLHLFDHLPPTAWSIDRYIYGILVLSLLMGAVFYAFNRRYGLRSIAVIFFTTFTCIWILFDVRMSAEIVSYAVHDMESYVLPDLINKEFRTHGTFYAAATHLLPSIQKYDRFVVLQQNPSPYYSNLRYMSYPSVATLPGEHAKDVKLFAVFGRGDIRVNEQSRLVDGKGEILTGTGKIIDRFSDDTFLFAIP